MYHIPARLNRKTGSGRDPGFDHKRRCGNRENDKYLDGIRELTAPREARLAKIWAWDARFFRLFVGNSGNRHNPNKRPSSQNRWCLLSNHLFVNIFIHIQQPSSGAGPGFFLGGGAPLKNCVTNTSIARFFCEMPIVLESRRSSQGGVRNPYTPFPP